jgi:Notch-like protein
MTKEIENIIKSFKSKNSCGYDKISVKILKVSSPFITAPLNYICNRSILSGSFPTQLKYSVVKPLFNKDDKKDIKNYRPISLLTSFSKIFEKVIYIRDRLCGLVVRVLGYRSGGPGSIPSTTRFS